MHFTRFKINLRSYFSLKLEFTVMSASNSYSDFGGVLLHQFLPINNTYIFTIEGAHQVMLGGCWKCIIQHYVDIWIIHPIKAVF